VELIKCANISIEGLIIFVSTLPEADSFFVGDKRAVKTFPRIYLTKVE